jgi:hypothetical protein
MNSLIDQLVRDIEGGTERQAREPGNLLYLIEDAAVTFKQKVRARFPEFRPWNQDATPKEQALLKPLPNLLLDEGERPAPAGTHKIIFLDDVLNKRTR